MGPSICWGDDFNNSGTENLDWTAKVLKRIIEFTQNDGIIHLIVHGINVGTILILECRINNADAHKRCVDHDP